MELAYLDLIVYSFCVLLVAAIAIVAQSYFTTGRPRYGASWIWYATLLAFGLVAARSRELVGEIPAALVSNLAIIGSGVAMLAGLAKFLGRTLRRLHAALILTAMLAMTLTGLFALRSFAFRAVALSALMGCIYAVFAFQVVGVAPISGKVRCIGVVITSSLCALSWWAEAIVVIALGLDQGISTDANSMIPAAAALTFHLVLCYALAGLVQERIWNQYIKANEQLLVASHYAETRRILSSVIHRVSNPLSNLRVIVSFMASRQSNRKEPADPSAEALQTAERTVEQAVQSLDQFRALLVDQDNEPVQRVRLREILGHVLGYLADDSYIHVTIGEGPEVVVKTRPIHLLQSITSITAQLISSDWVRETLLLVTRDKPAPAIVFSGLVASCPDFTALDLESPPYPAGGSQLLGIGVVIRSLSERLGVMAQLEETVSDGIHGRALLLTFPAE
jgi:signal transduction histidine kinase